MIIWKIKAQGSKLLIKVTFVKDKYNVSRKGWFKIKSFNSAQSTLEFSYSQRNLCMWVMNSSLVFGTHHFYENTLVGFVTFWVGLKICIPQVSLVTTFIIVSDNIHFAVQYVRCCDHILFCVSKVLLHNVHNEYK